ncbi:hypothetical protein M0R89_23185 (plasmid) [Halorussus limi]|uniref:Uncharacterized protein n=1 Tax=Halorussus limi TaxID=2938695 RepID=A0A8U0I1T5_9EURY|nr:hypothetical protein [Halorussus limi]UPV77148.1 hypothetical protein M0R89_23185 [Halorussus limi]
MTEKHVPQSLNAAQLQEAIDTIVQTFDYPAELSIQYSFIEGTKRTEVEIQTSEAVATYELVYDGERDEAEPELTQID